MLSSVFYSSAMLAAALCIAALIFVRIIYRRLRVQNHRLVNAIDNMSQGPHVFDERGRITLLNRRYLEMYNLSPDVVKPGCSLQQLLQARKETGLFSGEVEPYCRKILDEMRQHKSMQHYVPASDGRIVLAKNGP